MLAGQDEEDGFVTFTSRREFSIPRCLSTTAAIKTAAGFVAWVNLDHRVTLVTLDPAIRSTSGVVTEGLYRSDDIKFVERCADAAEIRFDPSTETGTYILTDLTRYGADSELNLLGALSPKRLALSRQL
jgi:hypothetical protein